MSRKTLTAAVVATTIAWSIGLSALVAPLAVQAAPASGSLVKASLPAVYYVGADGKRYVFPNEKTYKTWYADFSGVLTITDAELAAMPIGGNVTYKPGVRMVKITTDPKTYAVGKGGVLRWVKTEAVAVALYGSSWNQMIDDVPDWAFTNYTIGADINGASDYSPASEASIASINVDKNLGASAGSGAFVASLSFSQPVGGTVPSKATGVTVLKVDIKNNGASAMSVDSMTVKRTGPGSVNDFAGVYAYEGNNRLSTSRTLNSTTNDATFSGLNVSLAVGETKTLLVVADIAATPGAGNVNMFQVTNIMSGSTLASGLPVSGPSFTMAAVTVGNVVIDHSGTISNPKAGQSGANVAEFKLTAGSSEDIMLNKIVLYYGGTVSASNISNLVLKQAGSVVATAAGINSKDQAVFVLATPFSIAKGNSRIFDVYADISGMSRAAETVTFYLDQNADLLCTGATYGYGVQVSKSASDTPAGSYDGTSCTSSAGLCSYSTVQAGQLTITFNGPAAKDIPQNGKQVELLNFTMAAQANLEVKQTQLTFGGTLPLSHLTNVEIVDSATGAIIAGPYNAVTPLNATEVYDLAAGSTRTFKVIGDFDSTSPDGNTISVTLKAFAGLSNPVRNLDNSTNLQAGDYVPASDITGNTHTIRVPSLALSVSSTPVAQTFIQGAQGAALAGYGLQAGSAGDVKVSAVKLTGFINGQQGCADATHFLTDAVSTLSLWNGSTQVGDTKSPATSPASCTTHTGGDMTFDNLNLTVAKGTTLTLTLKANLSAGVTSMLPSSVDFTMAAGDVTATDVDGNSVAATGGTVTGPIQTIQPAGALSVVLAPDDTESEAGLVVGDLSNVVLGKLKWTAQFEELKVTKAEFAVATADAVASLSIFDGSTLVAGPSSVNGSTGAVDFTDLNFVVPKDGSKVLTVKGTMATIGTGGADTGSNAQVTLNQATFEARGTSAGSSTVLAAANVTGLSTGNLSMNQKIVRKTKPTVSLVALPSAVLTAGTPVVQRFTVSADAKGDVSVKKLVVHLSGSFLNSVTLAQSGIRRVGDGTDLAAADSTMDVCTGSGTLSCNYTIILDNEEVVSAGTSKTYDVRINISGTLATGDTLSSNLLGDSSLVVGSVYGVGLGNFVWSDISGLPHDTSSSLDWTNSLYVKVLPTDVQTMSK